MRKVVQAAARTPLLLLVVALSLAACTSNTPGTTPPTGAGAPAAATATPASPAPSPSPVATSFTTIGACPVAPPVCDFAARLNQRLASGNFDAVVLQSTATSWDCPGPTPRGAGDAFPLCEGSRAGEQRMGYTHARLQSEGTVMSADQYREFLRSRVSLSDARASDAYGTGHFALRSIGCPQPETVPCAQQFVVAFSSIQPGQQSGATLIRTLLMFFVEQASGAAPQIKMVVDGALFSGDPHEVVLKGGTAQTLSPRGLGPFGVFHTWAPEG